MSIKYYKESDIDDADLLRIIFSPDKSSKTKTRPSAVRKSQGIHSTTKLVTLVKSQLNEVVNPYLYSVYKTLDIISKHNIGNAEYLDIENKEELTHAKLDTEITNFLKMNESTFRVSTNNEICKDMYIYFETHLFATYKILECTREFAKSIPVKFKNKCINFKNKIDREKEQELKDIIEGTLSLDFKRKRVNQNK